MFANYHTHTIRCNHAVGTEREYIEAAIKAGFHVLGFSDHSPYITGPRSATRMRPEQVGEYVETLKALREEYKNDIKINIGFELEYYPTYFEKTIAFLNQFDYEYLILGQHYIDDGLERYHVTRPGNGDDVLEKYVDLIIDGIKTGRFSYVAHPDVINYAGEDSVYKTQMTRLCRAAKEVGIPLEINCAGINADRCYPTEKFWKIAGEIGNSIIIGIDAHSPDALLDREVIKRAEMLSRKFELFPLRVN